MFKLLHNVRPIATPLYTGIRLYSTGTQPKFGFALDIDGVLIKVPFEVPTPYINSIQLIQFLYKGNRVIPQAKRYCRCSRIEILVS
jgi:hypothetical protein